MALLGCHRLGIEPPDTEKRLFAFVEMDRCFADAIAAVTGCRLGKRTLKYVDYGKAACTFYDDQTRQAVRILAREDARDKVGIYTAGSGLDKRAAQVYAYRVMPEADLFIVQEVILTIAAENRPGRPLSRVTCAVCGEGINDRREVYVDGQPICRACAQGAYYQHVLPLTPTHPVVESVCRD